MTQEQAKEIVTKKVPLPKGYRWYWRNELVEIIDSKKNYIIQSFLWTVVSHAATGIQIKYFEKIASNLKNVIGFKDYTKGE